MNYADIRRLVKLVESSDIGELEIEEGGARLKIAKQGGGNSAAPTFMPFPYPMGAPMGAPTGYTQAAQPIPSGTAEGSAPTAASAKKMHEVQSPMVGTYYRAPGPEAPPYVQIGDMVRPGQVLCIVEAMKLMNEIESEVSGRIAEIRVENAQPVEFGQILFRIDPA